MPGPKARLWFRIPSNYPKWMAYRIGAMIIATTEISLIRMFSYGPEVSLKGSPTVSPVTVALCI